MRYLHVVPLFHYSYTRCIPSRVQKDIVKAAKTNDADSIALDGMQRLIANIQMEHKVSYADMETIFREIGGANKTIPADQLIRIIAWKRTLFDLEQAYNTETTHVS